jgi:hypothetical protein
MLKDYADPIELLEHISLHDAYVTHLEYNAHSNSISLHVSDLYANYEGLPEYPGLRPCSLQLQGVKTCFVDVMTHEGIRITDTRLKRDESGCRLEIDLNLGGGVMTEGYSSIVATFETLLIKDDTTHAVPNLDDERTDRAWRPGEDCPQPGD